MGMILLIAVITELIVLQIYHSENRRKSLFKQVINSSLIAMGISAALGGLYWITANSTITPTTAREMWQIPHAVYESTDVELVPMSTNPNITIEGFDDIFLYYSGGVNGGYYMRVKNEDGSISDKYLSKSTLLDIQKRDDGTTPILRTTHVSRHDFLYFYDDTFMTVIIPSNGYFNTNVFDYIQH